MDHDLAQVSVLSHLAAIARLQARLDERVTPRLGELRGNLEQCDHNGAVGWCWIRDAPPRPCV